MRVREGLFGGEAEDVFGGCRGPLGDRIVVASHDGNNAD